MQNEAEKNEVGEESLDQENVELMQFATADCDMLCRSKKAIAAWQVVKRIIYFPVKAIGYLVFLPFWPQHVTFSEINSFRNVFFSKSKRKRGRLGVITFYFVNWLAWHVYLHIRKLDLDINDGQHAWEIIQQVWKRAFVNAGGEFFPLFAELRVRNFEEFLKRDKSYFMRKKGNVFTDDAREALYYLLILSYRGNKFIRLLYGWVCGLIDRNVFDVAKKLPVVLFISEDRQRRIQQIKNMRREILGRIEAYANNMFRIAMDHGDRETAIGYNDVICFIQDLKGVVPSPQNYGRLAIMVKGLVDQINASSRRMYVVTYQELQKVETTDDNADDVPAGPSKETKYGRFVVIGDKTHYFIRDTILKTKSYKITKKSNGGIWAMQMILNYQSGPNKTVRSDRDHNLKGWFQRGEAKRFKIDQIFMYPRWNDEKNEFISKLGSGDWRLWTDEEIRLSADKRRKNYIAAHPNGPPKTN